MKTVICTGIALVLAASAAQADIIGSQGDLTDGLYHNGSTPASNQSLAPATDYAYFTLTCNAGDVIEVEVNRTINGTMDPYCSVFEGNAIGLDTSAVTGVNSITGLNFLASGDDNDSPAIPGPFGDPHFSFIAPSSGAYTFIVSNFLGTVIEAGRYTFEIRATGSTVPTPGAAALVGLGGLAMMRRRRTR